jgi:hypothetical protein
VVVDDGSSDRSPADMARSAGVTVLRHEECRGPARPHGIPADCQQWQRRSSRSSLQTWCPDTVGWRRCWCTPYAGTGSQQTPRTSQTQSLDQSPEQTIGSMQQSLLGLWGVRVTCRQGHHLNIKLPLSLWEVKNRISIPASPAQPMGFACSAVERGGGFESLYVPCRTHQIWVEPSSFNQCRRRSNQDPTQEEVGLLL